MSNPEEEPRSDAVADGGRRSDEEAATTGDSRAPSRREPGARGARADRRGSLAEGASGRRLRATVALFAVAGGGFGITVLATGLLGPGGSFGLARGGGAGAAAAATLSIVYLRAPLVALGAGAWIGRDLHGSVTTTALVATAAGALAMIAVSFVLTMLGASVLWTGLSPGFGPTPSVGDQVGPLVGVVVGTALTGTLAAEVVNEF